MPGFTWWRACDDEAYATEAFEAWDAKVRREVPASKLLVFETGKHGYKELAGFLGVPVPDEPYPRTSSSKEFGFVIGRAHLVHFATWRAPREGEEFVIVPGV